MSCRGHKHGMGYVLQPWVVGRLEACCIQYSPDKGRARGKEQCRMHKLHTLGMLV